MDKYAKSKMKLKILQMFSWMPDRPMICLQYRMKPGWNYYGNVIVRRLALYVASLEGRCAA